jgi:tRNA-dihydrouridine synthase B
VIENGAGVDLMRFPEKIKRILMTVRKTIKISFTIKIRSGWDREHINAVQISKVAEGCGVDAVSIHPRTRVQGFRGRADWSLIGEVKKSVSIPVIGNGDVTSPLLAERMMEETACDGVMIGRGALGNPWIFDREESVPRPALKEREKAIERHFLLLQSYYGDRAAAREIRKHIVWYTRGLPFSASFRLKLIRIKDKAPLFEAIHSFFNLVQRRNPCQSSELTGNRSATG